MDNKGTFEHGIPEDCEYVDEENGEQYTSPAIVIDRYVTSVRDIVLASYHIA